MSYDDGVVPLTIPHLRFALVLCMAKFLEALSVMFVLSYSDAVPDSFWLTRRIMAVTDLYVGSVIATLLTVTILTTFAIVVASGQTYLPDVWGRDTACYWGSFSIYVAGTLYYVYVAAENMLLIF